MGYSKLLPGVASSHTKGCSELNGGWCSCKIILVCTTWRNCVLKIVDLTGQNGELSIEKCAFHNGSGCPKQGFRPEISGKFHEENDDKPKRFWRLTTLFSHKPNWGIFRLHKIGTQTANIYVYIPAKPLLLIDLFIYSFIIIYLYNFIHILDEMSRCMCIMGQNKLAFNREIISLKWGWLMKLGLKQQILDLLQGP